MSQYLANPNAKNSSPVLTAMEVGVQTHARTSSNSWTAGVQCPSKNNMKKHFESCEMAY